MAELLGEKESQESLNLLGRSLEFDDAGVELG